MFARRPLMALTAALLLSATSIKAYLAGGIDMVTAGTRFLVAFVVAWVGVTILGMVVAGYGSVTNPAIEPMPGRRRSDPVPDSVPDFGAAEGGGERVGVDDGEPLSGPREGDVEGAQALGGFGDDAGRLGDDHAVELEPVHHADGHERHLGIQASTGRLTKRDTSAV